VELELLPYQRKSRKSRRKLKKADTNLIVINEECQLCKSMAKPVGCSQCYTLLCEDCVEYVKGKAVCSFCRDELQKPKRLAKVLVFPVGAPSHRGPDDRCPIVRNVPHSA
jgi:hypothetical protein